VPPAASPEAAVLAVPWDDGGWLSPTHVHTWLAPDGLPELDCMAVQLDDMHRLPGCQRVSWRGCCLHGETSPAQTRHD